MEALATHSQTAISPTMTMASTMTARIQFRTRVEHPTRLQFTVSSLFTLHRQHVLTDTWFVLLSAVVLIKNNLYEAGVGRYFLRDNLGYVRVHTSTSDYLPSTGFFFLSPSNQQTVMVLLETHNV